MFFSDKGSDKERLKLLKPFRLSQFLATYLIEHMHLREFDVGDAIISQGDQGESMFLVGQGRLRVVVNRGGDESIEVGQLGHGDYFGETSLIDESPRSATVFADEGCHLYEIHRSAMHTLLNEYSDVYQQLKTTMLERQESNRQRLGLN